MVPARLLLQGSLAPTRGSALGSSDLTSVFDLQPPRRSPSCGCAQYDTSLRSILRYREGRGGVSSVTLGGLALGPVYEREA